MADTVPAKASKLRARPGNSTCAECTSPAVDWLVLEYGVLVCIRCAGAHRSLGTHISKVRSIDLDQFSEAELQWAAAMGNVKSNSIFEAALPARMRRPEPRASDTIRHLWLRAKYDEQSFVAGAVLPDPLPHERCSGWLQKRADVMPAWRLRYFAIRPDGRLYYFSDDTCSEQSCRGSFALAGSSVEEDAAEPLQLRLTFGAKTKGARPVRLMAASQADVERWVWALYQVSHAAALARAEAVAAAVALVEAAAPGDELSTQPAVSRGGSSSEASAERHKRHALDIKGAGRDRSSLDYATFERQRSASQLERAQAPLPSGAVVRVVCVRHGMGHHNDGYETASFMNRDAELNSVGLKQAENTGKMLRSAGLLGSPSTLVVISPMRRTLQTAVAMFGSAAWGTPTVVQPLAAETSLASRFSAPGLAKRLVANWQQGDHGSTPEGLRVMFPPKKHPQLDFTPVDEYCGSMGRRWAAGGADAGRWWHHGNGIGYESCHADAVVRAATLRQWLAREAKARGVSTIVLVSHGGILKLAFQTRPFANAEFRCFELSEDGEVVGGTKLAEEAPIILPSEAATAGEAPLYTEAATGEDAPMSLSALQAASSPIRLASLEAALAEEAPFSPEAGAAADAAISVPFPELAADTPMSPAPMEAAMAADVPPSPHETSGVGAPPSLPTIEVAAEADAPPSQQLSATSLGP